MCIDLIFYKSFIILRIEEIIRNSKNLKREQLCIGNNDIISLKDLINFQNVSIIFQLENASEHECVYYKANLSQLKEKLQIHTYMYVPRM